MRPIDSRELERFIETLQREMTNEVKKKRETAKRRIPAIVSDLLWDAPPDRRVIDATTAPVLERRLRALSLPKRLALMESLAPFVRS